MHHITRRSLVGVSAALLAAPAQAQAQAWPSRPVRCLVGAGPGGTTDILARLLAPALGGILGQPVVVENRVGGGGVVAAEAIARGRPDGQMMILLNNAHAAAAAIFRRLPFDPIEDFAPAGVAATMPLILLSARNSEYSDLATLLAAARARPGALNYASVGIGTTQHFVAEALQAASGVTLTHVPYRTTPDALIALRNGDVQLVVETVAAVLGQVRDGEMRPLAITSAARSSALPAVPTVAEAGGLPGFDLATWFAFAFTAGTPVEIIARLNAALVQALADPALRDQVVGLGLTPVGSTPEGARAAIQREIARSREIVARAGIPQQ